MRILSISPDPIAEIPFLNAGRGPGGFYEDRLPILDAVADRLPDGVSLIIAAADLQGRERFQDSPNGVPRLLGEALPNTLVTEILPGLGLDTEKIGVFLAGDLYTVPALDRHGGSGDVRAVWEAFGDEFSWVVGVAGNHDTFGADPNAPPRFPRHLHYLDNDRVNVDGLKIAGLGGIIGNPRRPRRRSDEQYTECLEALLRHRTDILITHDGPNDPIGGHRGTPCLAYAVREDDRQNVNTDVLRELGLQPGPWLKAVKDVGGVSEDTSISIAGNDCIVGDLRKRLVINSPGDSIAYVTDFFLATEADGDRLVGFLSGSQTLVCENNYRDADADLARKNYHMTSSDVARLANRVGPAKLVLFHVSDRYDMQAWQEQLTEVRERFDRAEFPQEWGIE